MSGFAGLQVDESIVRRAQRGDRRALDIVFRTMAPAVYTLCLRLCQSGATADDLTQETFVEVMRGLPGFRFEASLATWVRTIAVSRAMMHFRSAWQRKASDLDSLPEEPRANGADVATRVELTSDIGDALGMLSPTARSVVWLYDVEGYTHKEIAELMDRSVSFSKSCLSRAHERLRELLSCEDDADGDKRDARTIGLPTNSERGATAKIRAERCLA